MSIAIGNLCIGVKQNGIRLQSAPVMEFKFKMPMCTLTLQEKRKNTIEARCSVGGIINNTSHFSLMEHHVPEVPAAND